MISQFEKLVQNFEVKRVGGAPKGHQLTPLKPPIIRSILATWSSSLLNCSHCHTITKGLMPIRSKPTERQARIVLDMLESCNPMRKQASLNQVTSFRKFYKSNFVLHIWRCNSHISTIDLGSCLPPCVARMRNLDFSMCSTKHLLEFT